MRITKSEKEIRSVEDWFAYAPPKMGVRHWKDWRSAKELAKAWFRGQSACAPEELRRLLEGKFGSPIEFIEAKAECVIELDDFPGEHRNCDVVMCRVGLQSLAVDVEAKADEPFGKSTVGNYYDQRITSKSNVPARIEQLSLALFGRLPDETIRRLRYQLVHSAAATLTEASANRAQLGLLLVHEFRSASLRPKMIKQNATDWIAFVQAFPELATARIENNQILGPVRVPGGGRVPNVPLYLGKLVTELK